MRQVPPSAIAAVWAFRIRDEAEPYNPTPEQWTEIESELQVAWPHLREATPTFKPLTRRQREIYDYITDSIIQRGYAPSFEEMAERMGFASLSSVHEHLVNLEQKGWISREYNAARAITLVESAA